MDELSPSARALLRVASSSDEPTADDAERVRHAVLARVGAVGIGTAALATAASTAQAKGLLGAASAKFGAALVVVLGGAATATYLAVKSPEPAPSTAAAVATSAPVEKSERAARADEVVPEAPPLRVEDLPTLAPEPVKRTPLRGTNRAPEPAATQAAPVADDHLQAEMSLIRGADAALRGGRPSEALSLLSRHASEHPKGLLAHEREGLKLIARCQSGAQASAAPAAEAFLERAPRSPLATRLRSACGIER